MNLADIEGFRSRVSIWLGTTNFFKHKLINYLFGKRGRAGVSIVFSSAG